MGLITKEVEIKICGKYISYYESLGYKLPKHYNKKGELKYSTNETITVKVKDLPKNSHIIVDFPCDKCGILLHDTYQNYNKRIEKDGECLCLSCSQPKKY